MAFLESAVVVYLRMIYYPGGFDFPLQPIEGSVVVVELWRELATIAMLLGTAVVAGRSGLERFAFFLYNFAIWDIFYYVFLKLLINWPPSLMTWDILFLIPVTWTGPVITPVIASLLMLCLSFELIYLKVRENLNRLSKAEMLLLLLGSLMLIVTFCWDYSSYILSNYPASELWSLREDDLFNLSIAYSPVSFNYSLFAISAIPLLLSMYLMWKRASGT